MYEQVLEETIINNNLKVQLFRFSNSCGYTYHVGVWKYNRYTYFCDFWSKKEATKIYRYQCTRLKNTYKTAK